MGNGLVVVGPRSSRSVKGARERQRHWYPNRPYALMAGLAVIAHTLGILYSATSHACLIPVFPPPATTGEHLMHLHGLARESTLLYLYQVFGSGGSGLLHARDTQASPQSSLLCPSARSRSTKASRDFKLLH